MLRGVGKCSRVGGEHREEGKLVTQTGISLVQARKLEMRTKPKACGLIRKEGRT